MSSLSNSKSFGLNKIPPIDEHNFAMWKTKVMVALETMDYEIHEIIEEVPYVPMYHPMANNAPVGPLKQKPKTGYEDDDKRLLNLNVKATTLKTLFPTTCIISSKIVNQHKR